MLNQSEIELLHLHACLQMQYKHPKKAVVLLKAIVLCAPECKAAQRTLALACLEAEEYESSVQWCQTLLVESRGNDKTALLLCLSRAYWRLNKGDEARKAYDLYIDMYETSQSQKLSGSLHE
ncbi:translocation protein Y [Shewanella sp. VB17]|uniref:type III secretion apparatus assembly chaperone SctY n=1 Tax=Shewanella sp. VB17 TaxID=2739432 RepID=UPI00156573E2|nr:translocation protein Y [Shewanella sp. VB17]NRD71751.1 translocation protein Y [Shewanella sp. VB17]